MISLMKCHNVCIIKFNMYVQILLMWWVVRSFFIAYKSNPKLYSEWNGLHPSMYVSGASEFECVCLLFYFIYIYIFFSMTLVILSEYTVISSVFAVLPESKPNWKSIQMHSSVLNDLKALQMYPIWKKRRIKTKPSDLNHQRSFPIRNIVIWDFSIIF